MLRRIAIVGASLAGLRAAETLRARGFDGALTLIGDEPHRPYDRPPLSKQVLQGTVEPEQTFFRKKDGYDALALEMRLGVRATALDLRDRYEEVRPGYHMNKKHWNTVEIEGGIPAGELRRMIDHSFELVIRSLPKAARSNQRRQRASRSTR